MKDLPDDDVEFTIIGTEQLAVDLRDQVLTHIKHLRKPWQQMSEGEQYETANGLEQVARHLVHNAVMVIADRGFPSALVNFSKVTIKGEKIEGTFATVHTNENLEVLAPAAGGSVMLVVADPSEFFGDRPAKVDPDQPDLALGAAVAGEPEEDDPDFDDLDPDPEPDEPEEDPEPEEPGAEPEEQRAAGFGELGQPAAPPKRRGRPRKSRADALS